MSRIWALTFITTLAAQPALAQDLSGLFSKEGIEVRADARVFTLFALFNGLGYDRELQRGPAPLQAPAYTELRGAVRLALAAKQAELAPAAAFVQAHPEPLAWYIERALLLGPPPGFAAPEGADADLQALAKLLESMHQGPLAGLVDTHLEAGRAEAKRWLQAVDARTDGLRERLRLVDDPDRILDDDDEGDDERLVIVANPLDSHGTVHAVQAPGVRYLVVGPPAEQPGAAEAMLELACADAILRPELHLALKGFEADAIGKALAARGVDAKQVAKGPELIAAALAAAAARQQLAQAANPGEAAALSKAADAAMSWYATQKQPFAELAGALVAKLLGVKAPAAPAKGGS